MDPIDYQRKLLLQQFVAAAERVATFDPRTASMFVRRDGDRFAAVSYFAKILGVAADAPLPSSQLAIYDDPASPGSLAWLRGAATILVVALKRARGNLTVAKFDLFFSSVILNNGKDEVQDAFDGAEDGDPTPQEDRIPVFLDIVFRLAAVVQFAMAFGPFRSEQGFVEGLPEIERFLLDAIYAANLIPKCTAATFARKLEYSRRLPHSVASPRYSLFMVRAAALSLSALPYLWTSLKRIEVEHLGQAVEILVRAATAGAVTTSWVRELVREDENPHPMCLAIRVFEIAGGSRYLGAHRDDPSALVALSSSHELYIYKSISDPHSVTSRVDKIIRHSDITFVHLGGIDEGTALHIGYREGDQNEEMEIIVDTEVLRVKVALLTNGIRYGRADGQAERTRLLNL